MSESLPNNGIISNRTPSFAAVVEDIVQLGNDKASAVVGTEDHQLRKLEQALRNRQDGFGLLFAVCNSVPLRQKLVRQIKQDLPNQQPVEINLNGTESSLLETLLNASGAPAPLFVYGIDNLLPSANDTAPKLQRESALQELQLSREHFRKLARPLLLWLPEYAYTMIGQQAVDFWSWQSGAVFFTELQEKKVINNSLSPAQLPPPHANFTGRNEEVAQLVKLLSQDYACIAGISGMGGVGKTTLALAVGERVKNRFPDAQLFLDLQGTSAKPLTVANAFTHVIHSLRPEAGQLPDDEAALHKIYLSLLDHQRALIVLDNAPLDLPLERLRPPSGSALLVTSRTRFAGVESVNLAALSPDEAREFLLTFAPRIGAQADKLAWLCGYLPLALQLAVSVLQNSNDLTPTDYVRRLERKLPSVPGEIEAALALSYDLLDAAEQLRLRALAVFPASFDRRAAAAVWELDDEEAAQDALSTLRSYSMLDDEAGRWRIHRLAQRFAKAQLTEAEHAQFSLRHAQHFCAILKEAGEFYLQGGAAVMQGLNLFDQERDHIEAGQAWAAARSDDEQLDDKAAARLCMEYVGSVGVNNVIGLRLHPRERIRWLESQLAADRRLRLRDYEGAALGNLGIAYKDLGESRQAITYYEQQLVIAREIGDRLSEGTALSNLGVAYNNLGESRQAITYYEQALVITRKIGDRRGEGNALGNLGNAYYALGDTRQAITYYEQQLVITREIGDRRGEGGNLGNLGIAYKNLGETRQAITHYEQALVIRREIGDRRGEGADLWNLALALDQLGERAQAIAHAEASLKIKEEIEDPWTDKVRQKLAEWRSSS